MSQTSTSTFAAPAQNPAAGYDTTAGRTIEGEVGSPLKITATRLSDVLEDFDRGRKYTERSCRMLDRMYYGKTSDLAADLSEASVLVDAAIDAIDKAHTLVAGVRTTVSEL